MLDLLAVAGGRGQRSVESPAGLDRGLLVGADDEVAGLEPPSLPAALVEVEDAPGLLGEVGVAGEDPRAVAPRLDRVLGQPPPHRRPRDLGDDPALDRLAGDLSARPARERNARLARQLAGERLDLGDLRRGKKTVGARTALAPQAPPRRRRRTACATPTPTGAKRRAARRSRRWRAPAQPTGSPSRAPPPASDRSTPPPGGRARAAARRSTRSGTGSTSPLRPRFDTQPHFPARIRRVFSSHGDPRPACVHSAPRLPPGRSPLKRQRTYEPDY